MWKINHLSGVTNQASPKGQWSGNLKALRNFALISVHFKGGLWEASACCAACGTERVEVLCSGCCLNVVIL